MKLLVLGPSRPDMISYLESFGDEVMSIETAITGNDPVLTGRDFLISYGYRYILRQEVLDCFPQKAINLHVSMLPWNKGADPNLWSFLEDTPKGVTIHLLEKGIDTGNILAQRPVEMSNDDTLRSSYKKLSEALEALFRLTWPGIREGKMIPFPQPDGGSFHRVVDKAPFESLLVHGWDTPVSALVGRTQRKG